MVEMVVAEKSASSTAVKDPEILDHVKVIVSMIILGDYNYLFERLASGEPLSKTILEFMMQYLIHLEGSRGYRLPMRNFYFENYIKTFLFSPHYSASELMLIFQHAKLWNDGAEGNDELQEIQVLLAQHLMKFTLPIGLADKHQLVADFWNIAGSDICIGTLEKLVDFTNDLKVNDPFDQVYFRSLEWLSCFPNATLTYDIVLPRINRFFIQHLSNCLPTDNGNNDSDIGSHHLNILSHCIECFKGGIQKMDLLSSQELLQKAKEKNETVLDYMDIVSLLECYELYFKFAAVASSPDTPAETKRRLFEMFEASVLKLFQIEWFDHRQLKKKKMVHGLMGLQYSRFFLSDLALLLVSGYIAMSRTNEHCRMDEMTSALHFGNQGIGLTSILAMEKVSIILEDNGAGIPAWLKTRLAAILKGIRRCALTVLELKGTDHFLFA